MKRTILRLIMIPLIPFLIFGLHIKAWASNDVYWAISTIYLQCELINKSGKTVSFEARAFGGSCKHPDSGSAVKASKLRAVHCANKKLIELRAKYGHINVIIKGTKNPKSGYHHADCYKQGKFMRTYKKAKETAGLKIDANEINCGFFD